MTDRIDGDAIREGRQGQSLQQEPNYWQAQAQILTGLDHRNDASVQAWLRHDGQFATDRGAGPLINLVARLSVAAG